MDKEKLQIVYYNNMEFFKNLNQKLFYALTQTPTLYNLHIDSYGYNIIHIPTQKKQYPLIARKNAKKIQEISPETHTTSMQETHEEIAENPLKNPKWELFVAHALEPQAHFVDEGRLPLTGKHCNALLREGVKLGLESYNVSETKDSKLQQGHEINREIKNNKNSVENTFESKEKENLESLKNFENLENLRLKNLEDSKNIKNPNNFSNKENNKNKIGKINEKYISNSKNTMQQMLDSETFSSKTTANSFANISINSSEKTSENYKVYENKESSNNESLISKTAKHAKDIAKQGNNTLSQNFLESFCSSYFLPQTNIYGLMGGLFLQQLIDSGYYFYGLLIYEENIDLFRISLYFVDYAKLFSHVSPQSCFIIIKDISFELVNAFLYTKKLTNNFFSLSLTHYTTKNVTLLKNFIYKEKKSFMRGWGSFEDELVGFHNACINLKNCKLLSTKPSRVHAPICVIGNGASLDLCIDFLKTYKDSMILLSCGTALKVLRHHDIKPDFQIEIERIPYLSSVLKEAGLDDIPLLFAQTTDTKACDLSKERYGFLRGGSSSAYLDSMRSALEFSAPFVGNAGVSIAALLGSDVLLCGIDCGYIEGYGKHAKQSYYGDEEAVIPNDCFKVEGNKNLEVFSNDLFYLSAKNIEQALKVYKPNNTINLSYGMKIKHTLSLSEDSFTLQPIDKVREIKRFKENFETYNLNLNTREMLESLESFGNAIKNIAEKNINNAQGVFTITQDIFVLLQKSIDNKAMRASVILLEGSIMHISYSHLLAQLFSGNMTIESKKSEQSRKKLKKLYFKCILSIIEECKSAIIRQGAK